ncbi:MAG TPA: AbrB/MazE/SpoVT family DNA-binding domain-containing protein [Propionibacteriaceae bacterium]|nr:AbrB/MazE/SpoVT family DNA-binding domain-containing protein [Propionibacteriaceae bacterium]HQE31307.1 AbrB/MazE/SpoVT family DNA-binding domain-containing protein [Propionibacteriaceae bacterium]
MMVTIDGAGRVVIPKDIRSRLGLDADSRLDVVVAGDTIVLAPVRQAGRTVVEVDGWPVLEAVDGRVVTDSDVQRWRDDDQR